MVLADVFFTAAVKWSACGFAKFFCFSFFFIRNVTIPVVQGGRGGKSETFN